MKEKLFGSEQKSEDGVRPSYEEVRKAEEDAARSELKTLGLEYRNLEVNFREDYRKKEEEFRDDERGEARLKFCIENYEDKIRSNRFKADLDGRYVMSAYDRASLERVECADIGASVEVKSGVFYGERAAELREKIRGGDAEDSEKKEEMKRMDETLDLVLKHFSLSGQWIILRRSKTIGCGRRLIIR